MFFANDPGKNTAFNNLFTEYFAPLCAYCQYAFGLSADEAKDAVHAGFINLLEANVSFSSTRAATAYLKRTVANICIDLLRHEKIKQAHIQSVQQRFRETVADDVDQPAELKDLQEDINKAIAGLPDSMRAVFELSRNGGMKYAEIARQLNISLKTVETQMSRALAKLRQQLAAYLSVYWVCWMLRFFF